jgi:hypothetical protein
MAFIVDPRYISLKNWAASLVVDFPNDIVPILEDENKWEDWANNVIGIGSFAKAGLPPPFIITQPGVRKPNFQKWEDWAKVVYSIMINE